jgi:hypothetical protein
MSCFCGDIEDSRMPPVQTVLDSYSSRQKKYNVPWVRLGLVDVRKLLLI